MSRTPSSQTSSPLDRPRRRSEVRFQDQSLAGSNSKSHNHDSTHHDDAAGHITNNPNRRFPSNNFHKRNVSTSNSPQDEGSSQDFRHRRSTSQAFNLASVAGREPPPAASAPDMVDVPLDPPPGSWRAFYQKNKGLAYVLLAQVFGVSMNVTTRVLEIEGNKGAGLHPFQILFVRMAITTCLSTFYMWWTSIPHFPLGMREVRWLLLVRGAGGFFGVFGMYYSLLYLPLADATVITFIAPSLSCWACSVLLKEPFTRIEQLGALISFIGVTLIARPATFFQEASAHTRRDEGFVPVDDPAPVGETMGVADLSTVSGAQRFGAVCVALTGVLGSAMAFTAMRWIGKRAHPLLSVNYFCAWCTIVSAVAMVVLPNVPFALPQTPREWTYLIFLGICGFAMQFLLSAGLQHEKSSRATNMVYTQMLFALILDKLVFGVNPTLLSLGGSSLILGSAIYVAMQKESLKQREEAHKAQQEQALSSGRHVELRSDSNSNVSGRRSFSGAEGRGLMSADPEELEDEEKNVGEPPTPIHKQHGRDQR
ncbi:MAG: hypothetical protein M1828_007295 [Chrysothrix sp. TS-e1954]|nr:MAG: hypothetical protein M1828_007295 [Chrysothrix sp. TS-e1954]